MTPPSRKPAPRQDDRSSENTTDTAKSTTQRIVSAQDILARSADAHHATPDADERREAQLIAELSERGYTVSVRCKRCRHPLTDQQSVDRHVGPKCAAKTEG